MYASTFALYAKELVKLTPGVNFINIFAYDLGRWETFWANIMWQMRFANGAQNWLSLSELFRCSIVGEAEWHFFHHMLCTGYHFSWYGEMDPFSSSRNTHTNKHTHMLNSCWQLTRIKREKQVVPILHANLWQELPVFSHIFSLLSHT